MAYALQMPPKAMTDELEAMIRNAGGSLASLAPPANLPR
jgi:hypothetical protein